MEMHILTDDVKEKVLKLIDDDLQFVDLPKEILCSNCFVIPLFHYIYPCSHHYCRDCYVDLFQRHNKKCRVCKREIGEKMLQSKELEFAIYKLKVYCPNKEFGCKNEIELHNIMKHLEECKFPKEKQLPKLYDEENETNDENTSDINDIKLTIGKMKTDINDLVLTIQNSTNRDEQLIQDNKRLSEENEKLTADVQRLNGDVRILLGSVGSLNKKNEEFKEQMEQNKRESNENASLVKKDFESVYKELQLQSDTIKTMGPEIEKKMAGDVTDLKTLIENSKQSLEDFRDKNIKILAQNNQLVEENRIIINEIKNLATENRELAKHNSNLINLISNYFEEYRKAAELNVKCMNNYKNLKMDCENTLEISNNQLKENLQSIEEHIKTEFQKEKQTFEEKQEITFNNQKIFDEQIEKKVDDALQEIKKIQQNREKNTANQMKEANDNIGVLAKAMDTSAKWFEVRLKNLHVSEFYQKEIQFLTEDIKHWQNKAMLWKIRNYDTKRKTNASVSSGPFCSDDCEHLMRFHLTFGNDGYLYSNIKFYADKNNELLTFGFFYQATISIIDQSDGSEKRNWTRVFEPRFGTTAMEWMNMKDKFIIAYLSALENTQNKSKYLKNDSLYVKVLVEPLHRIFGNYFSNNGILLCTIDNYARTKLESEQWINFYFYSDYFYSSEQGYRMQARFYWGGSNIYFYLLFLVGENDSDLPSFYSHKCTVFVVNQIDDSGEKDLLMGTETLDAAVIGQEKAEQQMKNDCCYYSVIDYSEYEKDPFLINGKMVFKVIVEKI